MICAASFSTACKGTWSWSSNWSVRTSTSAVIPGRTSGTVWSNTTWTSKFVWPSTEEMDERFAVLPISNTVPSNVVSGNASIGSCRSARPPMAIRIAPLWAKSSMNHIRKVKAAMKEATRIYAKLVKMGVPLRYLNVGGGNIPAGVDIGTESDQTYAVLLADVDADGDLVRVGALSDDRIGAHEQLRIYGRILGVTTCVVRDATELRSTLSDLRGKHLVLIDSISPRVARRRATRGPTACSRATRTVLGTGRPTWRRAW